MEEKKEDDENYLIRLFQEVWNKYNLEGFNLNDDDDHNRHNNNNNNNNKEEWSDSTELAAGVKHKTSKPKKYPYMEYDDEAKAIYIHLQEPDPQKYKMTTEGKSVYADYDKDDKLIGIEILLPASYNPTTNESI